MIRLVGYSYSPPTSYLPRVGVRVAAVSRIAHLLATALRWFVYHMVEKQVSVILLGVIQVQWLYCAVSITDP